MNKIDILTVEMSELQAERFVQFQKYYTEFTILIEAGVFDLKGAQAVIDFKDDGQIQDVKFNNVFRYKLGYAKKLK